VTAVTLAPALVTSRLASSAVVKSASGEGFVKFDAIILGSGQGGNPLAHRLADLGWSVALIEGKFLGGTCINVGCTPTKTMVHRAHVAHYARNAARWGVNASNVSVDLPKIVAQKDAVVLSFRNGQENQVKKRPTLRLFRGHGRFVAPHQIQVNEELLESEKIFINAGGRPAVPQIPGLDSVPYLTNESILQLTTLPEHLLVLGAGYVGLEILHRGPQILPNEDFEVTTELQKALEAESIQFVLGAETKRIESLHGGIALSYKASGTSTTVSGSHLLVATGRRSNTAGLGLNQAGIASDSAGNVLVNHRLETNVSGIWALGDCKGPPAFTHISYNDFQIIYGNLIEGKNLSIKDRYVPYCVFTDPQLGCVGLTEKEARAKGHQLKIGKIPMTRVARAVERDETAGMMKIIVDATNDKILGASILASEAGELVQILGALMLANQPYTLLKGGVFIHPTLAEGFFALLEDVKPVL
jgi:pyruvate/2-oxoglutarate dehydrogenase complex dihydrolipoamide dehydrogenase (E3) component